MAVGQAQAHDLLHSRAACGLPRAGARPGGSVSQTLPEGRQDGQDVRGKRARDLRRHLPRARHAPLRGRRDEGGRPRPAAAVVGGGSKFYLTTAIDYSNGDPHLGHALEKVGADCIARYRRLRGDHVHFLMGMDEHSQSVIQAAPRRGVTPRAWVGRMALTVAEVVRLLEDGLQDVSISRQRLPWGIPFPGDAEQTVYVWFDALINYLSATGFPEPGYERRWPADLHVIGKGITRFHCVIWPAMLLAAGLALPAQVWAHGYVQWEGTKMSKTAGTAVSVDTAIERHGADALRYFLLREVGFENDGNFTWDRFDARYTADLADTFGNLVSRALSMVQRYRGGIVPDDAGTSDSPLESAAREALAAYTRAMDAQELQEGAALVIELASRANRYVEATAPWKLAKAKRDVELDVVLASLVRVVARLAVLAAPFIPQKAETIWNGLGVARAWREVRLSDFVNFSVTGQRVSNPPPLFPKPVAA